MYSYDDKSDRHDNFNQLVNNFMEFKKGRGENPGLPISSRDAIFTEESGIYTMESPTMPPQNNENYLNPVTDPAAPLTEKIKTDMSLPEMTTPNIDFYSDEELAGETADIDEIMTLDNDMHFMRTLAGEINQRLHPFITEVLDEYEYEGSPIFTDAMDREFIAQLVDRVLERAAQAIEEVDEIHMDAERGMWCRFRLLRSMTEISLLHDLYGCRRPRYRRVLHRGFNRLF